MGREEIAQERLRGSGEKYMYADPSLRGRRMLKKPLISPTQPRRAKTRPSTGKAAGESEPEEVPTALRVGRSPL